MGHDHARSGIPAACAAILIARGYGDNLTVPMIVLGIILTMGAALVPDLDHPSATAAHTFGPITRGIAEGVNHFGEWFYYTTKSARDKEEIRDGHRTASHTLLFALAAGAATGAICQAGGRWALLSVLFILASLAIRGAAGHHSRDHDRHRHQRLIPQHPLGISALAAAIAGAAYFFMPATVNGTFIGICVAVGCLTHDLGDACTLYGCPILFPIPIAGQRWYLIGTPRPLRFRTGNDEENVGERRFRILLNVVTVLLLISLVPDSWGWLFDLGQRVVEAI